MHFLFWKNAYPSQLTPPKCHIKITVLWGLIDQKGGHFEILNATINTLKILSFFELFLLKWAGMCSLFSWREMLIIPLLFCQSNLEFWGAKNSLWNFYHLYCLLLNDFGFKMMKNDLLIHKSQYNLTPCPPFT